MRTQEIWAFLELTMPLLSLSLGFVFENETAGSLVVKNTSSTTHPVPFIPEIMKTAETLFLKAYVQKDGGFRGKEL